MANGDPHEVAASNSMPPDVDEIARFRSATAVMRTVYEVAMVLGLKQMIAASYTAFSPTLRSKHAVLAWYSDLGLFVVVLLISIRFFWVTRNITSYLRFHAKTMATSDEERIKVAREVILVHFPTIIIHALVFYFLSNSAAEAMGAIHAHGQPALRAYDFVAEFIAAAGVLLALNGLWLVFTFDRDPGAFWARNNLITATVLGALGGLRLCGTLGPQSFAVIASLALIINSLWDLWAAASFYVFVDDEVAAQRKRGLLSLWQPRWREDVTRPASDSVVDDGN